MRQLRLEPSGANPDILAADPTRNATTYKKCQRVVGDATGKYHPHGEVSVYDAMVRLAQTFSTRMPLVDGRAISAISTAITRRPCATPRRG